MRVSVSMWSYVSHVQQGKTDVLGFLDTAKALGVEGVELLDFFWKDRDTELPKVKQKLKDLGLVVSAFATSNDFTDTDPAARAEAVEHIKGAVDTAVELGTDRLRVFAGHHDEVGFDKALGWIIEGLKASAEYAATKGVYLCLENHGTLAGRGEQVKAILDAVGSPYLKANPDTGNFMTVKQDPVEAVKVVAPMTGSVHFKDFRWAKPEETEHVYEGLHGSRVIGTVIGEGDVDLVSIVKLLKDAGYDGFLTIEYEGAEDPETAMPRSVAYSKKVAMG
ncbi:MAG TPA: sugar phosphate isomerase/epimerase family protein [Armatimonadota bacterium]|jgi:sugar phosphate isomerase/epimerase|nr:sugar phosphate isomerase/epimerase family protein [Armatimonadota bacterium]